MKTRYVNAQVYRGGRFAAGSLLVEDGRMAADTPGTTADRTVDLGGRHAVPGLVDVHVHLREPGFPHKETIATGTAAAARGGYTTVCAMPNLNPAPDTPEHLRVQTDLIGRDAVVRVVPYASITMGQRGCGELVDFAALALHVAGFSDDGRGVQSAGLMEEAMRRSAAAGRPIVAHCEVDDLLRGGYIHDGGYCREHGHKGICSESEWRQVERDIMLAEKTGCQYHVCHVSTRESVELVRQAKARGLRVSCETAPHYLLLCDEDLQEDGRFKMNPPLRSRADRDALVAGIADGTIEVIATDHAPHTAGAGPCRADGSGRPRRLRRKGEPGERDNERQQNDMKPYTKKIVLENGREFYGYGFGADKEAIHEIVFNTSMVGYQEIISDPSYTGQTVVMTYPLIGNYGTAEEDYETKFPTIGGLIVREYNDIPSNFRYTRTLNEVFEEMGIPGISGVDTRCLTRIIRDEGSQKVMITDAATPHEMVARVSCKKRWFSRTPNHRYDVVAVDCGIKYNIIRCLNAKGCNVTVVPYDATVEEILAFRPDGIFLSNGPGDPVDVEPVIEKVRALKGRLPIFGICMGHQMVALAYGAKTFKMKFGHRGGNHPVKCLDTGKIEITSQNHSFAVDIESLEGTPLRLTHVNLLDNTAEGVECPEEKVFSVQYHPESAPGPQDSSYLFDKFIKMMEEHKNA